MKSGPSQSGPGGRPDCSGQKSVRCRDRRNPRDPGYLYSGGHNAFCCLGDVTADLKVMGLESEESGDFDLLVEDLLKYKPANTYYSEHRNACNIGTAMYEVFKALKAKEK